jgi:hemerythrin-like domain-containing protein
MELHFSASRILHDEHMASLALLREVERLVAARRQAPARDDPEIARFVAKLAASLTGEVIAHFDFEEDAVFPALAQCGDGDLVDLLVEEHRSLRETIGDISATAREIAEGGVEAQGWMTLRRLCGELLERLESHIDKEERALVPAMESAFTPEIDSELAARHGW